MKKIIIITYTLISLFFFSSGQKNYDKVGINLKIDGSKEFQQIDGFGVNINTAWWYDGEYLSTNVVKPAIDLLIDSLGATIFRAVIEEMDWEPVNDDNDPNHFNWTYYNKVFSDAKFKGVWNTLQYLNQKGITDGLIISLMGGPPAAEPLAAQDKQKSWMGDTDYTVSPSMEDEFVESIAALLYYARHKAKIQFMLVSPMNETDIISITKSAEHPLGIVEGPNMNDAVQFTRVVKKLALKLDAIGMSDIRFVTPDAGGDQVLFASCLEEMIKDPYLMNKLAHWGVHDYSSSADDCRKIVNNPANTNKSFWVTEMAGIGNLFGQLGDGPQSYIFWDGFDCVYQHARRNGWGDIPPNDWVFSWGDEGKPMIEYIPSTKSWAPRKQFYEFAQIFKYIKPGARRIAATEENENLKIYAFQNPNHQFVIVGQNQSNYPILIKGNHVNLPEVNSFEMFFTDSLNNLGKLDDIEVSDSSFLVTIPAKAVFTLSENTTNNQLRKMSLLRPEPSDWYSGDMHIHRDCGGPEEEILPENKFVEMMKVNDLAVISVLADMGNAEVKPSETDLLKVTGKDHPLSIPGRTIHYDAEWHWDPYGTTFEHKALGGHVVLLGMKEAKQIWEESTYKILDYGRKQNAIVGFCHLQYLNDSIQNDLNCCIPIEHVTEIALGMVDFIAEDVYSSTLPNNGNYNADATINAYYKFLNCGFKLGLAAGTDYPCNSFEPFGSLLTYVQIEGPFTYRKWVEGIRDGKTVVARNGHREFIDLKVNGQYQPGDDIYLKNKGSVEVEVKWTSIEALSGSLELVHNGNVVAKQEGTAKPGEPIVLKANLPVSQSSWICARRMDDNGHQTHTAPVYVTINGKPIRASAEDAQFFVKWIDNMIKQTSPGGNWNQYFTHDLDVVQKRYKKAKEIYMQIAKEANDNKF